MATPQLKVRHNRVPTYPSISLLATGGGREAGLKPKWIGNRQPLATRRHAPTVLTKRVNDDVLT